jgi:CubicO group peptidase (beta-lactamase class C family)
MIRSITATVFVILAGAPAAWAAGEKLAYGAPDEVAMSSEVLKAGASLFREAVEKDEFRGAVLLVARRGMIVLHEAIGWRDKDRRLPLERDTVFQTASNTKPVVAAGVLMLSDEGKLKLDDNVRKYLSSFDNYRSGFVQIRHLLNHTSGLRIPGVFLDPVLKKTPERPDAPSLRVEVDRFGEIGADKPPGTTYRYNNPGYNSLGALIEAVSGKPLERYLAERLYEPLGMKDTGHRIDKVKPERTSLVYRRREGKWTISWKPGDPPEWPFVRGSGGMVTTAQDYAVFCQMFLNGGAYGGKRFLKSETVAQATSPTTRSIYTDEELAERRQFYGHGWSVDENGVYSHGGSKGTFAWVDPRREIIGVVFTQSLGGRNPRGQFLKVVAAACRDMP